MDYSPQVDFGPGVDVQPPPLSRTRSGRIAVPLEKGQSESPTRKLPTETRPTAAVAAPPHVHTIFPPLSPFPPPSALLQSPDSIPAVVLLNTGNRPAAPQSPPKTEMPKRTQLPTQPAQRTPLSPPKTNP